MTIKQTRPQLKLLPFPHRHSRLTMRTAQEQHFMMLLAAGKHMIIDGDGGAGKNRLVGQYLFERSRTGIAIDIIGRPVSLLGQNHRVFQSTASYRFDRPKDEPFVLWIDEANRHDLDFLQDQVGDLSQLIITWSKLQGYQLPKWLLKFAATAVEQKVLFQNMRSDRASNASLAARFTAEPISEPLYAPLRRQTHILSRAESDPLSTALAILTIAVRYARDKRSLLALVSRPDTLVLLGDLAPQFPCPPIKTVRSNQIQGQDASILIYPTAEETPDPNQPDGGLFELEILTHRARARTHVIMQSPSLMAYAAINDVHAPFASQYARFIDYLMSQGYVVDALDHMVTLYDPATFFPQLVILAVPDNPSPLEIHENRRLIAASFSRKIPIAYLAKSKLLNDRFHPESPAIQRALSGAPRLAPRNGISEFVQEPHIITDLRQRYQSTAAPEKTRKAESLMIERTKRLLERQHSEHD